MDEACSLFLWVLCLICSTSAVPHSEEAVLVDRSKQMMDWRNKKAVIRMDGNKFRTYVKSSPRSYSVILMLTALHPTQQCSNCRAANDEFLIVANSWRYSQQYSDKLFFAVVDYDDAPDVFIALNITHVPYIIHLPPKGEPKKADTLDIPREGVAVEQIVNWIAHRTGVRFRVYLPPNYDGMLAVPLIIALIGYLLYLNGSSLKTSCGIAVLAFIFAMTSGQMWNYIYGPPFVHIENEQVIIRRSSQGQFIVESYIVIFLNAAVGLGMILLNESTAMEEAAFVTLYGLGCMVLFFTLLLSMLGARYPGYPYYLADLQTISSILWEVLRGAREEPLPVS